MKRWQLNFFATKRDLESLLRTIESKQTLQFVKTGLFDAPVQSHKQTLLDSSLGIATKGDSNQESTYLVADAATLIQHRPIPQHGGGCKYAIDQQINPKTVIFRPGGAFGEGVVLAGYVGTVSEDTTSLDLFQVFKKEINKQFEKIKSYYVGSEAADLLEKGWRLTSSVKSPPLYDLQK